jgi:hypothetical protein
LPNPVSAFFSSAIGRGIGFMGFPFFARESTTAGTPRKTRRPEVPIC